MFYDSCLTIKLGSKWFIIRYAHYKTFLTQLNGQIRAINHILYHSFSLLYHTLNLNNCDLFCVFVLVLFTSVYMTLVGNCLLSTSLMAFSHSEDFGCKQHEDGSMNLCPILYRGSDWCLGIPISGALVSTYPLYNETLQSVGSSAPQHSNCYK